MEALERERLIRANQEELGEGYEELRFVTPAQAEAALARREELLAGVAGLFGLAAAGTKPHFGPLSPGCGHCVAGTWSCLFVSGRCNCRCFYCPAPQDGDDVPMTNSVPFPGPDEYLAYLERFGFQGVGLSGGEPLLCFDTTLAFVRAVKSRFGKAHVWVYTNGTLADTDKLEQLRNAGLDEIRFDIGATDYRLDKASLAVGVIPCVTVEIPAVPEDLERMKGVMAGMREVGINHLNLHQLRLTPHNLHHLARRGYTCLHGEKVTVLESELAALELLSWSARKVGLPVNYCSFVYRDRFQRASSRKRSLDSLRKGHEDITPAGFLRSLTLCGTPAEVKARVERLRHAGVDPGRWQVGSAGKELTFGLSLWDLVEPGDLTLKVVYASTRILPALTYRNPFVEIELANGRTVVVERFKAGPTLTLTKDQVPTFHAWVLSQGSVSPLPADPAWAELAACESIPGGLQDYF